MRPSRILADKGPCLLITNCCKNKCGGCNQFCPLFKKEEKWTISLEQFKVNIDHILRFYRSIWLFGGEPLHHPQWPEIRELLYLYKKNNFDVSTNLVPRNTTLKNITYHSGLYHKRINHGVFVPTLIAPIDVFKIEDKQWYWKKAQQDCYLWTTHNCKPIIYNNRAYFCQLAGAFDQISGEDHGWPLDINKNPLKKTDAEIAEQASHFCYRCGHCTFLGYKTPVQFINKKALISPTNLEKIGPRDHLNLFFKKKHNNKLL